jgi:hypothetical protein
LNSSSSEFVDNFDLLSGRTIPAASIAEFAAALHD